MAASQPPMWVWIILAILIVFIGAWATNMACPAFGRSCPKAAAQQQTSGAGSVTPEQLEVIKSYF